jgi:MFS family permease
MIMFLIMSFPASYFIERSGIKKSLTTASVLLGFFSVIKAVFANSFTGVVISQVGLAMVQPVILNSVTALTVRWFPLSERGIAAGLAALAQYVGIIIAMLVTPMLVGSNPDLPGYGSGFDTMLWIYAVVSSVSAIAFVLVIREYPEGFQPQKKESQLSFGKEIIQLLKNRDMIIVLCLFFIGLGIFNAISAMTDSISENAGVKDSNGLIGGLMLIGGIAGAIVIPLLSDKFRKRKLFLVICIAGMLPGVSGLAFAGNLGLIPDATYNVLLLAAFVLGFFVMSAGPIGFQYAAEVCHPVPESTSQGMLLWIGQLSGMFFVAGMSIRNNLYLPQVLAIFAVLSVLAFALVFLLHESKMILDMKR